jgi:hypothetical protein
MLWVSDVNLWNRFHDLAVRYIVGFSEKLVDRHTIFYNFTDVTTIPLLSLILDHLAANVFELVNESIEGSCFTIDMCISTG